MTINNTVNIRIFYHIINISMLFEIIVGVNNNGNSVLISSSNRSFVRTNYKGLNHSLLFQSALCIFEYPFLAFRNQLQFFNLHNNPTLRIRRKRSRILMKRIRKRERIILWKWFEYFLIILISELSTWISLLHRENSFG